jgi:putative transposase
MRSEAHSKNLRLHRLTDAMGTFFITKSLYPKRPILDAQARGVVVSAFRFAVQKERIYLRAFVVMPGHWHALFALRVSWTLPRFMHDLMSYIGAKTNRLLRLHHTGWQDGYYDTHVKTAKQLEYVAYYIEQNPVLRGLADSAEQWDASSAGGNDLVTDTWSVV